MPGYLQALCLPRRPHRSLAIVGAGLLLAGLLLRLTRLDLMLFDFDEGVASIYALQLTQRGDIPLVGVRTSLGFYNPPLFIYLVAPAFLISTSPVVATAWLQLLGIASLAFLCWGLSRHGWRAGLITVLLLAAFAPGPLLLTQRLWGHALIPAFSMSVVGCILFLLLQPRTLWASFAIPLLVSGAQQVHFSGALLGISFLLCIPLARLRLQWMYFGLGVLGAALSYSPYLVHEYRTGFADLRTVLAIIGNGAAGQPDHSALWTTALHSLSDFGGPTVFQQNGGKFLAGLPWFIVLKWVLVVIWLTAVAASLVQTCRCFAQRRPCDPLLTVGLVWCAVPLLAFSLLRIVIVPAYWLVALPGPFLLVGCLVEKYSTRRAAVPLVVLGASAAVAMVFYVKNLQARVLDADPSLVAYPSYRDQREAVEFVSRSAPPGGAVLTQEARSPHEGVDYQILYLIAMVERGNSLRLRNLDAVPPAPQYILHSRAKPLPRQLQGHLFRRFGLLEVYLPQQR